MACVTGAAGFLSLISSAISAWPTWPSVERPRPFRFLQDRRYVRCRAFLADALDRSGPWQAAQQSYRDAEAVAPHMSFAYYRDGLAHLRHNDFTGGMKQLETAHDLSPNWADPLKAMGDALSGQKKWDDALDAYRQALPLAPNWSELQAARNKAVNDSRR